MRIQNNITAQNSHRQYGINVNALGKNMEKLSSGYRVNRAADDAAGLAISEKMRTQIRGLAMASRNSQDAISLVQTAEGALTGVHSMLQRMRELAVQSASDTNQDLIDREAIQLEFAQIYEELSEIQPRVKFNDMQMFGSVFTIQTGANEGDITLLDIPDVQPKTCNVSTRMAASNAITVIGNFINTISMARAKMGAVMNRLEFKIQNLDNSCENLAAAESRIRDADMAKMMTEFTKNNILFQSSTAMLAQANALPQGVLQLLG